MADKSSATDDFAKQCEVVSAEFNLKTNAITGNHTQIPYRNDTGNTRTEKSTKEKKKKTKSTKENNGQGDGWAVTASAANMLVLQADIVTPDPTDAVWPKWVGHAVLGTTSAIILYSVGKKFLILIWKAQVLQQRCLGCQTMVLIILNITIGLEVNHQNGFGLLSVQQEQINHMKIGQDQSH